MQRNDQFNPQKHQAHSINNNYRLISVKYDRDKKYVMNHN